MINDSTFFFFSVDARSGILKEAVHWSAPHLVGNRADFQFPRQSSSNHINSGSSHRSSGGGYYRNPPVGLVLRDVEATDDAEYHCRVDFRASPTHNVRVRLHVIGTCLFSNYLTFSVFLRS